MGRRNSAFNSAFGIQHSALHRLTFWGPVLAQMALIFVASSIPYVDALPGGFSDKTVHFWVYGVLGLLVFRALAGGSMRGLTWPHAGAAILFAMLYGVSDEFHQAFVPGRTPDVRDVAADTLGAAGVVLVMLLVGTSLVRRRQSRLPVSPPAAPSE
jgi:VanZ like family